MVQWFYQIGYFVLGKNMFYAKCMHCKYTYGMEPVVFLKSFPAMLADWNRAENPNDFSLDSQ